MPADTTYRKIADCSHQSTVTVVTGGMGRVICEACGDVTIKSESMISGDLDRSKFSRDADSTEGHHRSEAILGLGVLAASAFYRPFVFWSDNAWDLSSPIKPLVYGLVVFLLGLGAYAMVGRRVGRPLSTAVAVGLVLLVLVHWNRLRLIHPVLWIGIAAASGMGLNRLNYKINRAVAVMAIAVLGLSPIIQLVTSHVRASESYPIVKLAPRTPVEATGLVEDVLLVVVDSYPALAIADRRFEHDASALRSTLTDQGYEVAQLAWAQHTFTGLAIPSILELKPVVDAGPTDFWGNRLSTYELLRGNNLVAFSLRSAGYEYFHIESGWDASACGNVDVCLRAPWLDEITWNLLVPSVLGGWLVSTYGSFSVPATLAATESLLDLEDRFDNGRQDYVFAHLLLPHAPFVVNSECEVIDQEPQDFESESGSGIESGVYRSQLLCVDGLIQSISGIAGTRTAVMITADHGSASGGQVGSPPETWTDADIAERFGILLAYRLPGECPSPEAATNIAVMRAIMVCAVDMELPENNGRYLIGAVDPEWVDSDRMDAIQESLGE